MLLGSTCKSEISVFPHINNDPLMRLQRTLVLIHALLTGLPTKEPARSLARNFGVLSEAASCEVPSSRASAVFQVAIQPRREAVAACRGYSLPARQETVLLDALCLDWMLLSLKHGRTLNEKLFVQVRILHGRTPLVACRCTGAG